MAMKRYILLAGFFFAFIILFGCSEEATTTSSTVSKKDAQIMLKDSPELQTDESQPYLDSFKRQPVEWGEHVSGVKTRIKTDKKKFALTFDACGGDHGNGYDEELIEFLKKEQIPATLFVNERWIDRKSVV